jgi:hypothetical protein
MISHGCHLLFWHPLCLLAPVWRRFSRHLLLSSSLVCWGPLQKRMALLFVWSAPGLIRWIAWCSGSGAEFEDKVGVNLFVIA